MNKECKPDSNVTDCPLKSSDFIERLNTLESDMVEFRKYRHDRNEAYSQVLNEMRCNIFEYDKELEDLKNSAINNDTELNTLKTMHKEVIDALSGVMGRSGLIDDSINQQQRLIKLEQWQRDIKAFMAGMLAVCSVVSAGVTGLITYIITHWKS